MLFEINIGASWPANIAEKDGLDFLFQSQITQDVVYFWMTVLGDKDTAERYKYKLTFLQKKDNEIVCLKKIIYLIETC